MLRLIKGVYDIRFAGKIFLLVIVLSVVLVVYAERKLSQLVGGGLGESFSTRLYSAPFAVSSAMRMSPEQLIERLNRLQYKTIDHLPEEAGQYQWDHRRLSVGLRGFNLPEMSQEPGLFQVSFLSNKKIEILAPDRASVNGFFLEPELIAELSGPDKIRRDPTAWEEIPIHLANAVVAAEDKRFYSHYGLDPKAILRALWFNLRSGRNAQGGSTITQQVAKNLFLTHRRTWTRKAIEAFLAIYLDARYSKERILTLYLNHNYLGQDGFVSVAGVKAAARFYFDKDIQEITLPEAAFLAGLIRSPFQYNPYLTPQQAVKRRNFVLRSMLEENLVSSAEFKRAETTPLSVRKSSGKSHKNADADYFVAEVIRRMIPRYREDALFRTGLRIHTTLDPVLQSIAQKTVQQATHEAALVAIQPVSGRVLALTGGKNYQNSQFNRATQAYRQPGSAFKPFVFGAALEQSFTPATLLNDTPRAFQDDQGKVWAPRNFDGIYRGAVPLRQALAQSMNLATLDLCAKIGPSQIHKFARKLGIASPLAKNLAVALGVSEVTLLELTNAYAAFVNGGFQLAPLFVISVQDSLQNVMEINGANRKPVIDPNLAYLMTSLLQTTVEEGTAKVLKSYGWQDPAAGKTGTTSEGKDAWFIGYTPDLLVGVWTGHDQAKPVQLSGSKDALPLWAGFMKRAYAGMPSPDFEKPKGIVSALIDPISGLRARSGCPNQHEEIFLIGTEPSGNCHLHAGGIKGLFQRLFRRD